MKNLISIFILVLSGLQSSAQIKVISASRQSWSGGVAGNRGVKYSVHISWSGIDIPVLDSVYADGQGVAYSSGEMRQVVLPADRPAGKQSAHLYFGTFYNEMKYIFTEKEEPPPARATNGNVLLIFTQGHKRLIVSVTRFTELEPLNYP